MTTNSIKEEARHIAEQAVEAARERLVEPARDAVRQAREKVGPAVRDYSRQTRDFLNDQSHRLEQAAVDSRDRVGGWVSSNPFAAIGAAFVAGIVCSAIFRINNNR